MRFNHFASSDSFWDEVVRNIAQQPSRTVPETVVILVSMRVVLIDAVGYMQRFSANCSKSNLELGSLARIIRSHEDVIGAVDHALLQLSKGRGLTGSELWNRFERRYRDTAVHAIDDIANVLRADAKCGFAALSDEERLAIFIAMGGHSPLGAALARSPGFQHQVTTAFDDSLVSDTVEIHGPKTGAMQLVASFLGVSLATIRRRRAAAER